jgi:hypothetical protein
MLKGNPRLVINLRQAKRLCELKAKKSFKNMYILIQNN